MAKLTRILFTKYKVEQLSRRFKASSVCLYLDPNACYPSVEQLSQLYESDGKTLVERCQLTFPPRIQDGIIGNWKFDKTTSQELCSDLFRDGSLGYVPYIELVDLWSDWNATRLALSHTYDQPVWLQHLDDMELSIDPTTLITNLFTSSMAPSRIKSIRKVGNRHELVLTYGERISLHPINDKAMIISYISVFQPSELIRFVVKRKAVKK